MTLRRKLGLPLALAATACLSGGCYAGYGGYTGYGGYAKVSTGSHYRGVCRVSGGAEEFAAFALFYGGFLVIAGIVELIDCLASDDCG